MGKREERDSLGSVWVPEGAHFGAQTQRAVDNFPISGMVLPPEFIHALALVKACAGEANRDLGLLPDPIADAIRTAAREVMDGNWDSEFVVDVFQTGSGTSTNMNMNEVLASRSNELLTGKKGGKSPVHPNDHVNLGQSSNDVIPSVIHLTALTEIRRKLIPALEALHRVLSEKADAFAGIEKIGRTHFQDAVPITLGQECFGYAGQVERGIARLEALAPRLSELALGGTAVGTGAHTHPDFARRVISRISERLGIPFRETDNHFQAQASMDTAVETSGALKATAVGLAKIAGDLRLLASGPRCGLGEIMLPPLQPGSSIMPGKVNPVICEVVLQVYMQVAGNDTAILLGGQAGALELNTALPLIAHNLLQSIRLLTSAALVFGEKCIAGITADPERCHAYRAQSLALATLLVPKVGYDKAAELAKKAYENRITVREAARRENVLSDTELAGLFP